MPRLWTAAERAHEGGFNEAAGADPADAPRAGPLRVLVHMLQ